MINKVIMSNQYNIPNICELDNKVLMNDNTYNGMIGLVKFNEWKKV